MANANVLRLWRRLPLPLRAVLAGMFAFSVMQNGSLALMLLNFGLAPAIPWSFPLGLAWLWLTFRWFGGKGWPASTAEERRRALRAAWPSAALWGWTAAFFVVLLAFLTALINTVYRFQVIPDEPLGLDALPWWSLYAALLLVSIGAGVSEEAGFRGYMQGGLERRLGPAAAIAITSLLFWLAHLNHPNGAARWALLLAMAALLGALTWCAGTIWPAIVCHASLDTVFFVLGASETAPWFWQQPPQIADTGMDAAFIFFALLLPLSVAAAVWVLQRIGRLARS